jgi:hypothetical protein
VPCLPLSLLVVEALDTLRLCESVHADSSARGGAR